MPCPSLSFTTSPACVFVALLPLGPAFFSSSPLHSLARPMAFFGCSPVVSLHSSAMVFGLHGYPDEGPLVAFGLCPCGLTFGYLWLPLFQHSLTLTHSHSLSLTLTRSLTDSLTDSFTD